MTSIVKLTSTPVQITDGTSYAHMTVEEGYAGYADSAESTAWHRAERISTFGPPFAMWIRAEMGSEAVVKLSKATG